ncbi:MAG: hypothetical protein EA412_08210 [Chitinophagaceae bacterium]|nr:MAG: hypothetical protein EA412_08210 [Chitinophagaceae bacterium]
MSEKSQLRDLSNFQLFKAFEIRNTSISSKLSSTSYFFYFCAMNIRPPFKTLSFLIFSLFFVFLANRSVVAQEWEVGGWVGGAHYFGDLNTNTSFESMHPGGGVFVRYNINDRFVWKNAVSGGRVSFEDSQSPYSYQQSRNLSFFSNIFEISTQIEINFFSFKKTREDTRFTPYLLTGISGFYFNPKVRYQGETYVLQELRTEDTRYNRFAIAIPIGGGFKYAVNDFWTLGLEVANRKTFTDYLDDVSDVYTENIEGTGVRAALADRSGEVGEPIGSIGKQRGNVKKNDSFLFLGLTLSYTFRNMKCPKPGNNF